MKFTRLPAQNLSRDTGVDRVRDVRQSLRRTTPATRRLRFRGRCSTREPVNYDTPDFTLSLVRSSQTVAALKPKGADGFDFTPGDLLTERSQNGYFHLGDITLRLRTEDSANWTNYSTAAARMPVNRAVCIRERAGRCRSCAYTPGRYYRCRSQERGPSTKASLSCVSP